LECPSGIAAVSALLAVGPLLTMLLTATGIAMCGQ
jgi:hypothetical protein